MRHQYVFIGFVVMFLLLVSGCKVQQSAVTQSSVQNANMSAEEKACWESGGEWGPYGECPDCAGCLCDMGCSCDKEAKESPKYGGGVYRELKYLIKEGGVCRKCRDAKDCADVLFAGTIESCEATENGCHDRYCECKNGICVLHYNDIFTSPYRYTCVNNKCKRA